mmetsp:Transcript_10966/g.24481  ORF Transcript_10966/g.24481 Transcript_10966/m.24481 type:complete len:80 (+) Transcript_10966:68-307(+)
MLHTSTKRAMIFKRDCHGVDHPKNQIPKRQNSLPQCRDKTETFPTTCSSYAWFLKKGLDITNVDSFIHSSMFHTLLRAK